MPLGSRFSDVLEAAREGADWAWADLYNDLAGQVRGYLRSRGAVEPDDLVGEVFLHLARSISTFVGDESGFRSWVFLVAHHRIIDERRRRTLRPVHAVPDEELEGDTAPAAESEALDHQATDDVRTLLSILTPDQRHVLELRLIAGLTIPEIAEILEKPVGAVKALQRRGLAALRRALQPQAVPF